MIKEKSIHTFWYNPCKNELPLQDTNCIKSWSHQNRDVYVWTYGEIDAPELKEFMNNNEHYHLMDAEQVIPFIDYFVADYSHIDAHGFAMFSDLFRYELLNDFGGWWLDTDIILLNDVLLLEDIELPVKPVVWDEKWSNTQQRKMQNNAVVFTERTNMLVEVIKRCKVAINDKKKPILWGNTGPSLVTDMVENDLMYNKRREAFYLIDCISHTGTLQRYAHNPMSSEDIVSFFNNLPTGIHLWNSYIHKIGKIRPDSFVGIALELASVGIKISATTMITQLETSKPFIDVMNKNLR